MREYSKYVAVKLTEGQNNVLEAMSELRGQPKSEIMRDSFEKVVGNITNDERDKIKNEIKRKKAAQCSGS